MAAAGGYSDRMWDRHGAAHLAAGFLVDLHLGASVSAQQSNSRWLDQEALARMAAWRTNWRATDDWALCPASLYNALVAVGYARLAGGDADSGPADAGADSALVLQGDA